jgi:hypothetical protein
MAGYDVGRLMEGIMAQEWSTAGVHKMIGELCRQSYEQANRLPNGLMRKTHVPYSIPQEAQALIKALNEDDEHEAKRIMVCVRDGTLSLI